MDPLVRPLVAHYGLSRGLMATAVTDLTDGDAKRRSRAGTGPSVAWTIGHLCHWKIEMLGLLGRPQDNPFTPQFDKAAATDGRDYPALAALLDSWHALSGALMEALGATPSAQIEARMPGAGPHDEKKIVDTLLFFAWHEAYHIGAIGAIRKDLGRKAISELVRGK